MGKILSSKDGIVEIGTDDGGLLKVRRELLDSDLRIGDEVEIYGQGDDIRVIKKNNTAKTASQQKSRYSFVCPRCKGNNINVQIINETQLKRKHRNIIMWILFWWWVEILLWLFLFIPRFLIAIFGGKKQKVVNKTSKQAVCQDCGYSWVVK